MLRNTLSLSGFVSMAVFLLAGCEGVSFAKPKDKLLICEKLASLDGEYAKPFTPHTPGTRVTMTVSADENTLSVAGMTDGQVEVLYRSKASRFFSEIKDPNTRIFVLTRSEPVEYRSQFVLNIVSGNLYHESTAGSTVMQMYYAICSRSTSTLY